MDVTVAVALVGGTFAVLGYVSDWRPHEYLREAITQLVRTSTRDSWPVGVQEEDFDHPWGRERSAPRDRDTDEPPRPALFRVRSTVDVRRLGRA